MKDALLRGDLCHREPEFADLLGRLRERLPAVLGVAATHEAVLITGSGTAVMEAAVIGAVRAGRSMLVVNNGVYGDRLARIGRANGITVHEVRPDGDPITRWSTPIDPQAIQDALAAHPDVDAVACVQHETTTGMINPVAEIGRITHDGDRVFLTDAISSTANEDPPLSRVAADIVCGTSNKGLHGQPGLGFLLCSARGAERIEQAPTRSFYLHPWSYLSAQRNGDVPFTPAVQVMYALDEALSELTDHGGVDARVRLYRDRADLVRSGFERLGLRILVQPAWRSNSVTMLRLPAGVTYGRLHDELKRRGYVSYGGQSHLSRDYFRLCTMGEIAWHRLAGLACALDESIIAARA
ncbi:pyridoxal-phosphate-dependent aminotransferase family protein [Actinokineospora sp.]|uniref:pyridoxal-phosphate-dependent aminotransferase family protein n=1 Tax=Actinokineospora sp. TaxID=1872133 RepID=UPI0040384CA0